MSQLDLLLINPGGMERVYQELRSVYAAVEPPLWAGMFASFARLKGLSVALIDANADGYSPEDVARMVKEANPVLTAVVAYGQNPSASTWVMPSAGKTCTAIKEEIPDAPLLLVGGHVAALPEQTLAEEDVDYVCDSEGPYTLVDLVEVLKSYPVELKKVRGLVYQDGDQVVRTPAPPLVQNLDTEMPGVAWDLMSMDKSRCHNWHAFGHLDEREPYGSIYTSLGCPFSCHFCCIQAPFKPGEQALGMSPNVNTYRLWSPESVIAQIDTLVNDYGVKNIKFADELFVLNRKHVLGICDLIVERGYDLNIWAYARVDSCSEEMLTRMKQAGINWICLGIESASTRVCDDVNKGYKQSQLFDTVNSIKDAGIHIIANYLLGLPEDNLESMQQTLDTALELNCEYANIYCAMAYPGSGLYQDAMDKGVKLPDSWAGYSQLAYDTLPLDTNHLSGAEVLRFRDEAFNRYFSDPKYLSMIEQTFGEKEVRHIQEMIKGKIKRKYT